MLPHSALYHFCAPASQALPIATIIVGTSDDVYQWLTNDFEEDYSNLSGKQDAGFRDVIEGTTSPMGCLPLLAQRPCICPHKLAFPTEQVKLCCSALLVKKQNTPSSSPRQLQDNAFFRMVQPEE